jgi:hypothetical protein
MIAVTISFFGEWKTKTQIENEIDFGVYENEEIETQVIDKSNPHWSTFIFKNHEEAIEKINKYKKSKSFSFVVQILDLDKL